MQFRILIRIVLLSAALAVPLGAQEIDQGSDKPVTKREVRVTLRLAPETLEGIEAANKELIEKIRERSVDFALTREEEWSLSLQDASDELIQTIHDALPPEERERLLKRVQQDGLYLTFLANQSRPDANSRLIAVAAGKEFLQRYRNDGTVRDKIALLEKAVPALERSIPRRVTPTRGRRRN